MARKHDGLVEVLRDLLKDKPYVKETYKNIVYSQGEVDVLSFQGRRIEVYYEVKSNHTYKNMRHAERQLVRWTGHMKKKHHKATFYGVYFTPDYMWILAKNGKTRLNDYDKYKTKTKKQRT